MLRTDYALYLYTPHSMQEESKLGNPAGNAEGLTKTITNKIGGIAGLGSSENTTVISLEKTKFSPGENIKVTFDCDNSQCKKAVKSFKAKLLRKISCFSGKKGAKAPSFQAEEYLVTKKFDGIPEKVKEKKVVEFQIPVADKSAGTVDNLHPELRHMVKMFSDSTENALFKIEYVLDVFVKHQSKLEFGMGNQESFTIDIKSQVQDLPWVASKEETWMMNQGLNAW